MSVGPTRRAVLTAAAAGVPLLLSACRGVEVLGSPPPPGRDVTLLRSAIAAERLMVSRYRAALDQTGSAGGPQRATLAGILVEHQQHLAQLTGRLVFPAGGVSPRPLPLPPAGPLPAGLPAMISALASDEQAAADRLAGQLLHVPASLAQLMASIAASEATHVPALRAAGRPR